MKGLPKHREFLKQHCQISARKKGVKDLIFCKKLCRRHLKENISVVGQRAPGHMFYGYEFLQKVKKVLSRKHFNAKHIHILASSTAVISIASLLGPARQLSPLPWGQGSWEGEFFFVCRVKERDLDLPQFFSEKKKRKKKSTLNKKKKIGLKLWNFAPVPN